MITEINLITAHLYIGNNVPVYKDKERKQEWTINDYLTFCDDIMFIDDKHRFYIDQDEMDKFDKELSEENEDG